MQKLILYCQEKVELQIFKINTITWLCFRLFLSHFQNTALLGTKSPMNAMKTSFVLHVFCICQLLSFARPEIASRKDLGGFVFAC